VIVKDGEAQIMLAGDASYLEATMLSETVDGISPNESIAKATLARIRELCSGRPTIYLPTHDPKSGDRLSERRLTSVPR
jgi:N-acyl homoserine lactone hydrolase